MLDVAFASEGGGASFDKTTLPFIKGLGSRLAAWVDHHDHERHADYVGDPRFVLTTKAQHGACPEMVTPEVVRAAGPVDTVAMHLDLDGLYSGAKWVLGGRRALRRRRRRRARRRHAPGRARADRDAHRSGAAGALSRRDAQAPRDPVPGRAHEGARAVGGDRAGGARESIRCSTRAAAWPTRYRVAGRRRLRRGGAASRTTRPSCCCSGRSARRSRSCATRAR